MRYSKDDLPREKNEIRERDQLPHELNKAITDLIASLPDDITVTVIQQDQKKDIKSSPPLPLPIIDIVEKELEFLGKKNEKSSRKASKKKSTKVHTKSNKSAVAKI
jgi:hypothetical protein